MLASYSSSSSSSSSSSLAPKRTNLLDIAIRDRPENISIDTFSNADIEIALHLSWPDRAKERAKAESADSLTLVLPKPEPKKKRINTTAKTLFTGAILVGKDGKAYKRPLELEEEAAAARGDVKRARVTEIDKSEHYKLALQLFLEQQSIKEEKVLSRGEMMRQQVKPHEKLYDILPVFHNEFFKMTFDNKLSVVFYACITPENCDDLGLPKYFDWVQDAVSLTTIKVRIDKRYYNSFVEFIGDFRTMYQNVVSYFPPDSSEVQRSVELKHQMERRRKSNASKMSY